MGKLTKRESVLIYIMICLALAFALAFFLVLPKKEEYDELFEQNEMFKMDKQSMQIEIANYDSRQNDYDEIVSSIESAKNNFYGKMSYDDIDLMFTSLMDEYGLVPQTLQIAPVEIEDENEVAEESDEESQQDEVNALDSVEVTIEAYGYLNNLKLLIDEISKNDKLVLDNFNITEMELEDENGETLLFHKLNMVVKLNMIEDI